MKQLPVLLILASLVLPSTAHAIDKPTGSPCDTRPGQGASCFAITEGDSYRQDVTEKGAYASWANFLPSTGTYQMGQAGCTYAYSSKDAWIANGSPRTASTCVPVATQIVGHEFEKYMFPDIPVADRGRVTSNGQALPVMAKLVVQEFYGEGAFIKRGDVWVTPMANGNVLDGYCAFYRHIEAGTPTKFAEDATPQSVYDACAAINYFTARWSQRPPATVKPPVVAPATITVPTSAARCGQVGKVVVRTTRVACAPARSVIARYARSLRSPAGWTCRAVVTDAGRRASCTRKAVKREKVAPATIYGIWRP
jgi:hypothetical protein